MSHTLSQFSQAALDEVLLRFSEEPSSEVYESLGRMLATMFRNRAHPAAMFRLIAMVVEEGQLYIEPATIIAWSLAERPNLFDPDSDLVS